MSGTATPPRAGTFRLVTGVALIMSPLVGIALVSPGWFILVLGPFALLLLAGWAFAIAAAATVFFAPGPVRSGAYVAALTTSNAVVVAGAFFVDATAGGPVGSPLADYLCMVATALWLGGWLWLVVEWVAALVAGSRRRRRAIDSGEKGVPAEF
jgi:hypothetical protein